MALAWCAALGLTAGGDPTVLIELGAAALVVLWASLLGREVWEARSVDRALRGGSSVVTIEGVSCRVVANPDHDAFVLGAIRPTIYIGARYLASLDEHERRAVLLHEEYHRRTRAPLRAAALAAWLRLARRIDRVEQALASRVADLEVRADVFALASGVSPEDLASALLKGRSIGAIGAAYSNVSDQRIRALLGAARGEPDAADALPLEWLPLGILSVVLAACHLGLAVALA